jgi:hypothetical protein
MYSLVQHKVTIMEKSRSVSAAVESEGETTYYSYELSGPAWQFELSYRRAFPQDLINVTVLSEV